MSRVACALLLGFSLGCPPEPHVQPRKGDIMRAICAEKYKHPETITPDWRLMCERYGFRRT